MFVVIIVVAMLSAPVFAQDPYPYRALDPRQFDPAVDPVDDKIHFTNVHDATISGLETWLQSATIMDLISLTASYMYLSTEDETTGKPLAYRSKHTFKSSVDLIGPAYSVGLDFIYRSRIDQVKVYENDERVAIYVTDLRGEAKLGRLRLSAKVANLFQYNYTEIERNLAPILHYTLTLSGVY